MTTPTAPRRRSTGPPHSAHALDAPAVVVAAADPPVWIFARGARASPRRARGRRRSGRWCGCRRAGRDCTRRGAEDATSGGGHGGVGVAQVEATLTRGSSPGWCRRRRFESPRLLVRRRARLAAELAAREDGPVASVGEPRETLPATLWTLSPSASDGLSTALDADVAYATDRLEALELVSSPPRHSRTASLNERAASRSSYVPQSSPPMVDLVPLSTVSRRVGTRWRRRGVDRRRDARRGSAPDSTRLTRGRRDGANDRDERARTTAHRARRQ